MAFVVEDGTGLPDANSFVSVQYADEYFALRAVTAWDGSDSEKQAWLVQATDYISARFRFKGAQLTDTQALPFPRHGDGISGMPDNLLKATCEYAVRAKNGPLAPDIEVHASGIAVAGSTNKVGPIEESVQFATGGSGSVMQLFKPYPAADMLLRGLIRSGAGRVIRA